ncbi:MAG: glycosyl hydrolase [Pseudomonadota bacterium]
MNQAVRFPLARKVTAILALFGCCVALADVDPATFPAELRALEWREVGPFRGGRSSAATGIASDRDTYYFGATGGGVWKTSDGGESWDNVSDGFFGGSIGAVAVSEWDPNVVYVGTGEKTVRGNVSPGNGVWKSVDAGETWQPMGLEDSQHISRIRVHPRNPDVAYAAVMGHLFGPNEQRGVFRTKNGGESWERVLHVSDEVGAVDLVMDPTNPRILYTSFWRVKRTPYSLESGGPGSGIYKSVDGGDSWTELTGNDGLPTGTLGIIGLAVSPSNNQNLYAIIEAEDGGVFRSRNGGKTWEKVNEERKLRQRAWYYSRIYADPADEDGLYVVNVRFHRSRDGGASFKQIPTPHGDNHDLWIDPNDPLRMIEANDGGANVSTNGGETWTVQSTQPTVQFYRVAADNDFPYRLLGGQQDNSAVRIRSQSAQGDAIGVRDWEPTAGGESGHISAKPDNPDIVVGGSYGGFLEMRNHRTGERRYLDVWPDNPMGYGAGDLRYRFQWNFPLSFSLHDPDVLYAAANVVFRSDDLGQSWQAISPDLTRNDKSRMGKSGGPITKDDTGVEYYGTVFVLTESPTQSGVLWAGSDDGRIHVTRDGGENWSDVTPSRLPEWAMINSIDIDPFNEGGAYVAATRYKMDDFSPMLYHTTDWGKSWREIGAGLPKDHFTRALRADPEQPGLLYAGTERGLYHSRDNGRSWAPLQLNLPIVPVTDLLVKGDDLVAATQGRGYWILDDLGVLRAQARDGAPQAVQLYAPQKAYRLVAGGRAEDPGSAGTNPYPGVSLFYYLPAGEDEAEAIELAVFRGDEEDAIWTWTAEPSDDDADAESDAESAKTQVLSTEPGLHRHVWDLGYPGMERFEGLILWSDMEEGPTAVPGNYRAVLTLGDTRLTQRFEVAVDPRASASADDYQAQFDFVSSARDLLTRTHREIKAIRGLRSELEATRGRIESAGAGERLIAEIEAIDETITAVEEALYQTQNQSRQDPLNYPIRLNNKLTSLMRKVAMDDRGPTTQAWEVKVMLSSAIEEQLAALTSVWEERLPALNSAVRDAGISMISVDRGD